MIWFDGGVNGKCMLECEGGVNGKTIVDCNGGVNGNDIVEGVLAVEMYIEFEFDVVVVVVDKGVDEVTMVVF